MAHQRKVRKDQALASASLTERAPFPPLPGVMIALVLAATGGAHAAEPLRPQVIHDVSMAGRATASAPDEAEGMRRMLREQMRRAEEQARLIDAGRPEDLGAAVLHGQAHLGRW